MCIVLQVLFVCVLFVCVLYDKVEFRVYVLVLVVYLFVYNIGNEDFVVLFYNENEFVYIMMVIFVIGMIGYFEDGVEMWDDYG